MTDLTVQVDPFTWGSARAVDQIDACSVYLRKVIDTPKQATWIDASQHPTLLTVDPTGVLPFGARATTDLAIFQRSTARPHALRDRIMVLFEVCKAVTTNEYYQVWPLVPRISSMLSLPNGTIWQYQEGSAGVKSLEEVVCLHKCKCHSLLSLAVGWDL